jgi:hypothetical protein
MVVIGLLGIVVVPRYTKWRNKDNFQKWRESLAKDLTAENEWTVAANSDDSFPGAPQSHNAATNTSSIEDKMKTFAKRYKEATSEKQRLLLCIDAINQGLIYVGEPVVDFDRLFGTDYSRELAAARQPLETRTIHFYPLPPPPLEPSGMIHAQAVSKGWYLVFRFNSYGHIADYYVTNIRQM